jgi:hypothetical protein
MPTTIATIQDNAFFILGLSRSRQSRAGFGFGAGGSSISEPVDGDDAFEVSGAPQFKQNFAVAEEFALHLAQDRGSGARLLPQFWQNDASSAFD